MVTITWDNEGVRDVDNVHIGTLMNGQFFADLLLTLQKSIRDKRHGKLHDGVLRRQDNTPVHISLFAMRTVFYHGFKLLPRPPYFMNLVSSDHHLFFQI